MYRVIEYKERDEAKRTIQNIVDDSWADIYFAAAQVRVTLDALTAAQTQQLINLLGMFSLDLDYGYYDDPTRMELIFSVRCPSDE